MSGSLRTGKEMDEYQRINIFTAYFNGEYQRGTGGVIFIKGPEQAYMFAYEFTNKDFCNKLQETIDDDQQSIYVVLEKDAQFHLFSYKKQEAMQQMLACTNALSNAD